MLRPALYALGALNEHIELDQAFLKWLVSELNHKTSDARRVGALRLLGCLQVPDEASKSLLVALLNILRSVRESLNKKVRCSHAAPLLHKTLLFSEWQESTSWFGGGEDRSALLPLLGIHMRG